MPVGDVDAMLERMRNRVFMEWLAYFDMVREEDDKRIEAMKA